MDRSIDRSMDRSIDQSINEIKSVSESVSQSVSLPACLPSRRPAGLSLFSGLSVCPLPFPSNHHNGQVYMGPQYHHHPEKGERNLWFRMQSGALGIFPTQVNMFFLWPSKGNPWLNNQLGIPFKKELFALGRLFSGTGLPFASL